MISPHRVTVMSVLLLAMACGPANEATAIVFSSTSSNVDKSDCYGLKLQGAKGVPNEPSRQYTFKGICKKFVAHVEDGKEESRSDVVTLWAEAKAEWNGQANTLEESVSLKNPQGPYSGTVMTILKCTKDPIIYKASCVVLKHSNTTNWGPFSNAALQQKRPILQGKTTLKEATALSKKQASSPPPPPPPSSSHAQKKELAKAVEKDQAKDSNIPSSTGTGPATMFTVEAEQLVQANKALVNGGKVAVQPMAGFGSGWSGNAQLFWSGGAVGAVLDLLVDVPAAATYAVELYMTRAPDYADLKIEVDGKPSPVPFSGYAPTVMAPGPMQVGKFSLQPGSRKVSFMIRGKYQQSTGYFVGIDQVRFYPAGAP
ncbi:MAG: hypothetical protein HW377_1285 [Actinobacteria bacterium]|nr:hypothetical protein [Actinomycetota bacterium]